MKKDFENIVKSLSADEKKQYDAIVAALADKAKDYETKDMVYGGVRLTPGMKDLTLTGWDVARPVADGNGFPVFSFSNGARVGLRNLANASGWDLITNRPPMPSDVDELHAFVAWCAVKKVKFEVLDVRQETRNGNQRTIVVFRVYI